MVSCEEYGSAPSPYGEISWESRDTDLGGGGLDVCGGGMETYLVSLPVVLISVV